MCQGMASHIEDMSLDAFNVSIFVFNKQVILVYVVQYVDLMRTVIVHYVSYIFSCMC